MSIHDGLLMFLCIEEPLINTYIFIKLLAFFGIFIFFICCLLIRNSVLVKTICICILITIILYFHFGFCRVSEMIDGCGLKRKKGAPIFARGIGFICPYNCSIRQYLFGVFIDWSVIFSVFRWKNFIFFFFFLIPNLPNLLFDLFQLGVKT